MRNIQRIDLLLSLLVLLYLLLTGCAPSPAATATATTATTATSAAPTSAPEAVSEPRLRVTNAGQTDINNLTVLFPDSRILIGDVPAGATSDYAPAPKGVYAYAAYEFNLDGATVMQPVIDWVGESPLPGQSYTYVIELEPSRPQMQQITLVAVQAELNNE
jgi:hypothetical protein